MRPPGSIDRIRYGVVGEYVPVVDPPLERWLSGSLKLDDDEAVATLIADAEAFDEQGFPVECTGLAGRTETGDILLIGIRSRTSGQGNLPVVIYRSSYLLANVTFDEIEDDTVSQTRLGYHGLPEWGTDRLLADEPLIEDGKRAGWRVELRAGEEATAAIDEGFLLRFSPGWKVGGEFDRRVVATPLYVTVESDGRRPIGDHIVRIDAVHALLSIAHRNPVKAADGAVRLGQTSHWCDFWDANVMEARATNDSTQEFPYFGLDVLGGVEGVAAWVRLVLTNRRAVVPLVRHAIFGNQTPESRLLSLASAMESWVAGHRRTHTWAQKVKGENLPTALIRKVDPTWSTWVGDSDKWVHLFWDAYTHLKHEPDDDLDPHLVHLLELSGRWLLTADLLDTCAGSREPSQHLFGKSLWALGRDLREAVSEQP